MTLIDRRSEYDGPDRRVEAACIELRADRAADSRLQRHWRYDPRRVKNPQFDPQARPLGSCHPEWR
jgi:hypothetical protein